MPASLPTDSPGRSDRPQNRVRLRSLAALGGVWDLQSAFNPGDAEVPAQMRQIERADGPGDFDKRDLVRARQQDRDVADRVMLKVHPEPGHSRVSVAIVLIDQLLPPCGLIFLPYR